MSLRLIMLVVALAAGARATEAAPPGPPASVAVAFDRTSVRPVLAEGSADRSSGRAVGPDDPVRVASISKLVTTLGVMRLVDKGRLNLDADVSGYLGWRLRNPAFPEAPITLRMLLSHRSSLIDGEDLYLVPLGVSLRERLADPRVWDGRHAPGSGWFHYTNLNFPVVASAMERAGGERFDRLMLRLVMRPLKLDACFNWSGCPAGAEARAVVLYRPDGSVAKDDLHGRAPDCLVNLGPGAACDLSGYVPGDNGALFSPQGGLRISMRSLARLGQRMAGGMKGFLSPRAFAEMTTMVWTFDGADGVGENGAPDGFFCQYGLAVQRIGALGAPCRDDLFGDRTPRLGHAGDAYGLKAGLWWDPASGRGLAFFTTAVADDAAQGRSAFSAAEEAVVARAERVVGAGGRP